MNRTQIMSRLKKLMPGVNPAYRINEKAPTSPEERAEMLAKYEQAVADDARLGKALNQRTSALQAADEEYQRLFTERRAAQKGRTEHHWAKYRRIEAGDSYNLGGFGTFCVWAEGDTWDEVLKKIEQIKAGTRKKGAK